MTGRTSWLNSRTSNLCSILLAIIIIVAECMFNHLNGFHSDITKSLPKSDAAHSAKNKMCWLVTTHFNSNADCQILSLSLGRNKFTHAHYWSPLHLPSWVHQRHMNWFPREKGWILFFYNPHISICKKAHFCCLQFLLNLFVHILFLLTEGQVRYNISPLSHTQSDLLHKILYIFWNATFALLIKDIGPFIVLGLHELSLSIPSSDERETDKTLFNVSWVLLIDQEN